jgi:aminoglycoside 2''-phosphotransferase
MQTNKYLNLIKQSVSELEIKDYRLAQKGWDSTVLIINDNYIFRFPKRESSLESLKIEMAILPKLKESVNLAVPDFEFFSKDYSDYEKAFVGYKMIPGIELTKAVFEQIKSKEKIAKQLGEFLTKLHSFPLKEAIKANIKERNKEHLEEFYKDIQKSAFTVLNKKQKEWTKKLYNNFFDNPENFEYRKALVHTEIGDEHILASPEKELISGIIDFGDMAVGDYALDFYILKNYYGKEFYDQILDHYELPIDPNLETRIDFYYKLISFYLILGGLNLDKEKAVEKGIGKINKELKL